MTYKRRYDIKRRRVSKILPDRPGRTWTPGPAASLSRSSFPPCSSYAPGIRTNVEPLRYFSFLLWLNVFQKFIYDRFFFTAKLIWFLMWLNSITDNAEIFLFSEHSLCSHYQYSIHQVGFVFNLDFYISARASLEARGLDFLLDSSSNI